MGAGAALCLLIIKACEDHLGYTKPLILLHDTVPVNVSCAVGATPSAPPLAPDQPASYLQFSRYCFDPKFCGEEAFGPLCVELANSCLDCSLLVQLKGASSTRSNNLRYQLRCSCYRVQKQEKANFNDGEFAMKNTIPVRNKDHRSHGQKTIFDRFGTYKMKNKSAENTSRPQLNVGDVIFPENVKQRTSTARAKSKATRCTMKLDLLLNIPSQRWYLSHKSSLTHEHHHELPPEANKFESDGLDEDESSWMK